MLEPPSGGLLRLLRELRLCTPFDLRRCRGRVRRLASGLPAFDSVWIDALVQLGRLTPFQASILESSQPERLRVGPFVLVDRLGGGLTGNTYLARGIDQRELRTIKLIRQVESLPRDLTPRLNQLQTAAHDIVHPRLVAPQAWQMVEGQLVLVSRHVPGRTLKELLIRRGRFPARIVLEIGRQLLESMQVWQTAGQIHGDIRPANVRLQTSGNVVLVDAGVQPVLEPELTPHSQLAPERYDCIAPELIGTGKQASVASDLYALGCLLWQLLAGRPPFPAGDPLYKLAFHQTRKIRDVRDFAPDTPAVMAEMLLRLTSADPATRPASAAAVLEAWGQPRRSGRSRLASFAAWFESPLEPRTALGAWPVALLLAAAFALSGVAFQLSDQGARTRLLQIVPDWWTESSNTQNTTGQTPESSPNGPAATTWGQPLPAPDRQGVIELTHPGPYRVPDRRINQVGPLVIRGIAGVSPEIHITDQPLQLAALTVTLENVTLKKVPVPRTGNDLETTDLLESPPLGALLLVQSQNLTLRQCRLFTHDLQSAPRSTTETISEWPQAVAWHVPDLSDAAAGECVWENVLVRGYGAALDIRSGVRRVVMRNVLRLGPGVLLHLAPRESTPLTAECDWEHVTCRESGSVIRWDVRERSATGNSLTIKARGCVWDAVPTRGAVVEFLAPVEGEDWSDALSIEGDVCLKPPEVALLASSAVDNPELSPLDDTHLEVEGVFSQAVHYSGTMNDRPTSSRLRGEVPRLTVRNSSPMTSETASGMTDSSVAETLPGILATGWDVTSPAAVSARPSPATR